MAVDKLVDSTQLDRDLTAVANAIRARGGTSEQLSFPNGFSTAIAAIPTGGGEEPYTGDYEVTPTTSTQTLYTANKILGNNVTVYGMPTGSVTPNASVSSSVIGDGSYVHGSYDVSLTVTPSATVVSGYVSGDETGSTITRYVKGEKKTVKSTSSTQTITPTSGKVITEIEVQPNDVYSGTYTVTPSTSVQTLATNGKVMSDNVTVNALSGTKSITANGTNIPVAGYAYADVNVPSGDPYTGTYTVTPSTSVQTLATNGKVMSDNVTVNALSGTKSITANGTNIPVAGYAYADVNVPSGDPYTGTYTVTPSTSVQTLATNGKIMSNNVTVNAVSLSGNATAEDVRSGKTFYGSNLTELTGTATIPEGRYIEEYYEWDIYLYKVIMHGYDDMDYEFRDSAYERQTHLTSINLPSNTKKIGKGAFNYCSPLVLDSLPNTITIIGENAFQGCRKITISSLPTSLTTIGNNAFSDCKKITLSSFPVSLTSIGDGAFYGCSLVTFDTIPSTITSIGDSAFYKCVGITNIEIGCTTLGETAFYNCTGLRKVWFRNSCTTVKASAQYFCTFKDCSTSLQIYVEANSKPSGYGQYFNRTGSEGGTTVTVVYGQTTRPW